MADEDRTAIGIILVIAIFISPVLFVFVGNFMFALVVVALVWILAIAWFVHADREDTKEQLDYFMTDGRPLYDAERNVCTVTGKVCPVTNINCTCGDCTIAASSTIRVGGERATVSRCTWCGANFTEDQLKGDTITCEYCGKVHIVEK